MLPTLLYLLLGYWLYRSKVISERFSEENDRLCMHVLLPVLIFQSISQAEVAAGDCIKVIVFAYGVVAISLIGGALVVPRILKDRKQMAVVTQSVYRGNFTMFGIPFSQVLGGVNAAAMSSAVAAATLPLLNVAGVVNYEYYAKGEKTGIFQVLLGVLKNPLLRGVILGLLFRQFSIDLPGPIESVVSTLASIASPLAFLTLGSRLRLDRAPENLRLLVGAVAFKLLAMPCIFLPVAVFGLRLQGVELIPAFLFVSAPSAVATYQLAVNYKADVQLAGNLVIFSTLASTFTICILVTILKSMSLI